MTQQPMPEQDKIAASVASMSADIHERMAPDLAGLDPITQISTIVATLVRLQGWEFSVGGEPIDPGRIADPECMLPVLMWEVDRLHRTGLDQGTGLEFVSEAAARYGVLPTLPQWGGQRASVTMFMLEPLVVALERNQGRLDYLVDSFLSDYEKGVLPWAAASASRVIELNRFPGAPVAALDQSAPVP